MKPLVADRAPKSSALVAVLQRHPRHVGLAALIAGLLLSGQPGWAFTIAAGSVPLIGLATGRVRPALVAGALVLAGAWIGGERREAIDRSQIAPFIGHAVTARGHVVKRERSTLRTSRFRMRVTALGAHRPERRVTDLVQVRVRRKASYPIGRELEARGVLSDLPEADRSGYGEYLRRAGVHGVMYADSVAPIGARGGALGAVDSIRRRAEAGVGAGLEPRMSALATGIVLGQDERISAEMVEQFQASGLAHLLAVSGQNVTLLAVLALPILASLGLARRARLIGVLGLICLYVPLTGAGPSIMRAGAMGAAAMVAQLSGRPASRWYALLLACGFTLAIDPRAWLDVGWQLSFAAVVGIFCLGPSIRQALHRFPAALAEGAALTVAATVATGPLLAFHFERLSAVSLLANLVALPAVAPIMWIGTLAAAAGQFSADAAALINALNGFFLAYLAAVARWSAGLPGAVLPLRIADEATLAVAYLVPIAVIAAFIAARQRRAFSQRSRALRSIAIAPIIGVLAIAAWAAFGRLGDTGGRSGGFAVTFVDVGQGDATLLRTPRAAVLVDGGPADSGIVSALDASGVKSLDVVVLTHSQEDHAGGLEAVVRALPVQLLLDGGGGGPLHDRVVSLARSHGTRVVAARTGLALRLGELRIRVLSPPRSGGGRDDPNTRSVVALASYRGLDVLLTADAESEVTLPLPLPDVELLKVAHHGSADPGLAALLERLRPEIAVVEVGAQNRYGHPHPETLAALARSVPVVRRTDRDGDVTVSQTAQGLEVATER